MTPEDFLSNFSIGQLMAAQLTASGYWRVGFAIHFRVNISLCVEKMMAAS
jgi:hypothetical protein